LQKRIRMKRTVFTSAAVVAVTVLTLGAQTKVTPPDNKYTPAQDVELGLQAAQEARQQLPVMRDDAINSYVEGLGRRLVQQIEPALRQPEFRYSFETVNLREINAFALPGGPMFLHRGMIEAASTEGEMVSVMAHELSHVVLRHGTAQASKAGKYQLGQVAGAVIGAIIGGRVGGVVAQGTQFGLGTAFLRFGREYERQADLMGAQIMARAGYDPRDMAAMFRTIERQGGSNGPEWLSSHPNPGNRSEYITKEAQMLRVTDPVRSTQGFDRLKAHLKGLPPAPSAEQVARETSRRGGVGGDAPAGTGGTIASRVEPPSKRYREYREGDVFRIAVPSNWRERPASSSVTFAPDGAFGQINGQPVFTHGIEVGLARNQSRDLRSASEALLESLAGSNPQLRQRSEWLATNISGRRGLQTTLQNVSEANGRPESIVLITTQTRDGNLFYTIAVAPQDEVRTYEPAFQQVVRSIRLNE
jgi:beta-barrel assembly-enhancing protease